MSETVNTNPGNFANRPTEVVREIASMGGKAFHKSDGKDDQTTDTAAADPGRNADGTFKPGSESAKQAGHLGGLHSHQGDNTEDQPDRNPDGTFTKGSEAAKEAGKKGGLAAAAN